MKNRILFFSWIVIAWHGCMRHQDIENDLIYKIHEDRPGETIKEGDYVVLSSIEKTEEGFTIFNSYKNERPVLLLREKASFKGDFNSALGLLSEGDSATFKINLDSITKTDRSKIINSKGHYLIYTVKINKVIPRGNLNDSIFNSRIEAFHKAELQEARKTEPAKVKQYICSHHLKPTVTASGLNYVVLKPGKGAKAGLKDTVLVNYVGKLLSGKVFDTNNFALAKKNDIYNQSINYGPMKLTVVDKPVSGFQEALSLFSPGTKAELIIPSKLAYGNQGNNFVQPYSPLLCEIEIIKIIHHK